MAYLSDPKETIAILQKYHFNFQKKFGQNFLIDGHVVDKIIAAAGITKDDVVLEIGPGIGTMTQRLCEEAGDVVAVEIDRNLIPILKEDTCKDYKNLRVIQGDILKLDIKDVLFEYGFRPVKVVANLPYYITTPILMSLLESRLPIESITVMVQKEVAERMETGPGSKDYGALSLAVQYYAEPYLAANVPANCFMPRPNVGSAVIRLTLHDRPPVETRDEKLMFALIRASFNQRRKTLVNGLGNAAELSFTKEEITEALADLGFSPTVRGETLTLADFAKLADRLGEAPDITGRGKYPGNVTKARAYDEIRMVYAAPSLPNIFAPMQKISETTGSKKETDGSYTFCRFCGAKLAESYTICPACGGKQNGSGTTVC